MGTQISVQPESVWGFYQEHIDTMETKMFKIAENTDFGIEIWIFVGIGLSVSVESDDGQLEEINLITENNCETVIRQVYKQYLTDEYLKLMLGDIYNYPDIDEDIQSFLSLDREDLIAERENELYDVTYDFLRTVVEDDISLDIDKFEEICEDCKEHFLEYIYRKHNIDIHRPMELEDENGEDFFEEYPYGCFDFEDNPLYK